MQILEKMKRPGIGLFILLFMTGCTFLERREKAEQETVVSKREVGEKTRLKILENALSSRKDLEQYSRALPFLLNEQERIEFLELPGFEARSTWLQNKQVFQRSNQVKQSYSELIESQDIAVGMPQNLVQKSWGDPDAVEVSGNPMFRNERWRYNRYVASPEGYRTEKRTVYFEGGKVVGWDSE